LRVNQFNSRPCRGEQNEAGEAAAARAEDQEQAPGEGAAAEPAENVAGLNQLQPPDDEVAAQPAAPPGLQQHNAVQQVMSVKVAWGKLWSCYALQCTGGSTEYASYKPTPEIAEPEPHCLPSLLTPEPNKPPIQYAVELRHIQATCLNGCIPIVPDGPPVPVFAPYRPVGSHG
jgi:hypothetical protein